MSALAVVLVVGVLGVSPSERFESMMKKGVEKRREIVKRHFKEAYSGEAAEAKNRTDQRAIEGLSDRVAYRPILAPAPALNQLQTATAIAAATAAINTSLEGVEAGVSVSPLLLANKFDWPVQPTVTLAALEGGVARVGGGVAAKFGQELITPQDVRLEPCVIKDIAAFAKHRLSYLQVCEAVRAAGSTAVEEARRACGEGAEPEFIPAMGVLNLFAQYLAAQPAAQLNRPELKLRQEVTAAGAALAQLGLPTMDRCWTDDDVKSAAATAVANATTWNAGLSANVDLLPVQWGFAGDSTLTQGQYISWEARGELRWASKGREVGASAGFTRAREELDKPLWNSLALQGRMSTILASFVRDSVRDELGRVRVINGEIPPHVVLGLALTINVALTRVSTQDTPFNKLEFMPYVEAHFGEKLAVRLGVPVRAVLATRAAVAEADATPEKPAGPELTDLQWSIPATITTVIKLD